MSEKRKITSTEWDTLAHTRVLLRELESRVMAYDAEDEAGPREGRMAEAIAQAGDALFNIANIASSHLVETLTHYQLYAREAPPSEEEIARDEAYAAEHEDVEILS